MDEGIAVWQDPQDYKPSTFSFEAVERERQFADRLASSAMTSDLRLTLARYADLLSTDLPETARDRVMIRGQVVFAELQRRNGNETRVLQQLVRPSHIGFKRLTTIPELVEPGRPRSAYAAAVLNFFLWGAGYVYAGRPWGLFILLPYLILTLIGILMEVAAPIDAPETFIWTLAGLPINAVFAWHAYKMVWDDWLAGRIGGSTA